MFLTKNFNYNNDNKDQEMNEKNVSTYSVKPIKLKPRRDYKKCQIKITF